MESRFITAGVAVSVMSLASRFIDFPKPIGWAGFSVGAVLLLSNFLPEGYQPSPPQGILYLLGIGCLVGAFSWQILSAGSPQQNQQVKPSAPGAEHSTPAPQSRHEEVLWSAGGAIYFPGVPTTTTAYNGSTLKDLKNAVDDLAERPVAFDNKRAKLLKSTSTRADIPAVKRQAEIEKVEVQTTQEFQNGILMEIRPMFDELLERLDRPYPRTTSDGMTVSGYTALSSGILRGPHPLTDLAASLRALANALKA